MDLRIAKFRVQFGQILKAGELRRDVVEDGTHLAHRQVEVLAVTLLHLLHLYLLRTDCL